MKNTKKENTSTFAARGKKKIFVTSKGLEEAKAELHHLKETRRNEVAQRLQNAREYADLSENSEYDAAMEEQNMLEGQIAELEGYLKNVQVIKTTLTQDFVVIGSTVTVEMDGEVDEFTIVGRLEADPSKKKISYSSSTESSFNCNGIFENLEEFNLITNND